MRRARCPLLLALRVNSPTCNSLPDWDDQRGGKTLNHMQGAQPDPAPMATTRGCARDSHSRHAAHQLRHVSNMQRTPHPRTMMGCWSAQAEPSGTHSNKHRALESLCKFWRKCPIPCKGFSLDAPSAKEGSSTGKFSTAKSASPRCSGESNDHSLDSQR